MTAKFVSMKNLALCIIVLTMFTGCVGEDTGPIDIVLAYLF